MMPPLLLLLPMLASHHEQQIRSPGFAFSRVLSICLFMFCLSSLGNLLICCGFVGDFLTRVDLSVENLWHCSYIKRAFAFLWLPVANSRNFSLILYSYIELCPQ